MDATPRKILYVMQDLDLGGLQRMVHLLVDRLDRKQYQPYLCCWVLPRFHGQLR